MSTVLSRNNLLMYFGVPLLNMGGSLDLTSVVGILTKYQFVVVKPHTGGDLTTLINILTIHKTTNSSGKVFGYVDASVSLAAASAGVTQWQTDLGALLGGIYIDNFNARTRTEQNTLITTCHTANLPVMGESDPVYPLFEQLGSDPATLVGTSTTIRDYVLLDGFFIAAQNLATPPYETVEHETGRLSYLTACKINSTTTPVSSWNFGIVASVSAGTAIAIAEADYDLALELANQYQLDALGVHNFDKGAISNTYFMQYTSDLFVN